MIVHLIENIFQVYLKLTRTTPVPRSSDGRKVAVDMRIMFTAAIGIFGFGPIRCFFSWRRLVLHLPKTEN